MAAEPRPRTKVQQHWPEAAKARGKWYLLIDRDDRNKVGEEGAGCVELATIDDDVVASVDEPGFELGRPLAAEFRLDRRHRQAVRYR